jgi:hypothetical protein
LLDLDSGTLEALKIRSFSFSYFLFCYAYMVGTRGVVSDRIALDWSYVALIYDVRVLDALPRERSRIPAW